MQTLSVPIVNAFIDGESGGNPAAIVLNAEQYDQSTKQLIASRLGLSETAFVSPSQAADFKLEFFTPVRQIAQCGHATIATFSYLLQLGHITKELASMETVDGVRSVTLHGNTAFMEQTAPRYSRPEEINPEVTMSAVLASVGISQSDLADGFSPLVVNTGNSFMVVPLRSAEKLSQIEPDLEAVNLISQELGLIGYYAFAVPGQHAGRDATARMFAPFYGIAEEAATGMAAGPLACYLHDYLKVDKETILIEQGYLMQPTSSPSLLTANLKVQGGNVTSLMVGGRAHVSHTINLEWH
ncbi:PhzF family phenazine biosynthesis protein [Dyadobacter crusticola]|uniref:PhzF family phenazine biosynthesis protein n=1 Tax=Dyadobacter crusticola TaxID=292407 RepID=UPI0004E21769|nr:PhzF family phenazine biosynthesis protein [Dyadobacter crusticola]